MSRDVLSTLFEEVQDCKENRCILNRRDIEFIFKPDNGLKNQSLKNAIFGHQEPKLCDCIIKRDAIVLLEIKCGKITKSILKEIIEQLENVAKILQHVQIHFARVLFIYDSFENNKLKQTITNKIILGKRLEYIQFQNQAISI